MTTSALMLPVAGEQDLASWVAVAFVASYASPGTRQANATQLRLWFDWCERHHRWRAPGREGSAPQASDTRRALRASRPHSLRHAAITAALDAGCSLRDVQDFARHADPRQTRR
jgi:integrase